MNSKEKKYENMTPLEALEWIDAYSEDDVYHNITNEVNIIKKALSRLEQIEKERQEVENRLSSKETNTFDEIATMITKANDYDALVNKCKQLEKENQELKKRETPIILHGVGIEEDVFYGICDICGSTNRLAEHYDHKQQKWIKQGYCIHCGQKYDWSENND